MQTHIQHVLLGKILIIFLIYPNNYIVGKTSEKLDENLCWFLLTT